MPTTRLPNDSPTARCPVCGAQVNASESMRNERVHCPKCRKIVVLEFPAKPTAKPKSPPKRRTKERDTEPKKRIEQLEARVAALEKSLSEVATGEELPAAVLETEIADPPQMESFASEPIPDILEESERRQLVARLRRYPNHEITIKAARGEEGAFHLAEELQSAFVEAGWTVEGISTIGRAGRQSRIVLSAGTFPVPREVAVVFHALSSIGLNPASDLDPNQGKDDAVLIVNRPPPRTNGSN